MASATKKKRGRPREEDYNDRYKIRNFEGLEMSDRTARNRVNAEYLTCLLMESGRPDVHAFFMTSEGLLKHHGIAEQIGRMLRAGLLSDQDAIKLTETSIDYYLCGVPSKEIEKRLRRFRLQKMNEAKGKAPKLTSGKVNT